MKKLVALLVAIAAAYVAFNLFTSGELLPSSGSSTASEDGAQLNRLRGDFRAAAREYRQAGRSAGLAGVDTTAAAEPALEEVDRVETAVRKLARDTDSDELRQEAEDLLAEIADWRSKIQ